MTDTRPCTCHPDDSPPSPCQRKFSLTECKDAEIAALRQDLAAARALLSVAGSRMRIARRDHDWLEISNMEQRILVALTGKDAT
jgi:hypothetical protein